MSESNFLPTKISDRRLAEWLTSNCMGERYSTMSPVVGLIYPEGLCRWPIIPPPQPEAER